MVAWLGTHARSADAALALALVVAGQIEAWAVDLEGGSRAATVAAALVAGALLSIRRDRPRAVAVAVVLALLAKDALGGADELIVLLLAGMIAVFTVGSSCPTRAAVTTLAILVALTSASAVLAGEPSEVFFSAVAIGAPWVAGRALRDRTERAQLREELARRREEEAYGQARLAAAEERTRIARDLHDMVGHSVSLMVLQAGAAEQVAAERPEVAAASLAAIQQTGRATIDELRRLLGLLRDDDGHDALTPGHGMDDVEALVRRVRDAGLDVDLRIEGTASRIPEGIGLTVFRILQEALTNVVKHAGPAHARVVLTYAPRAVRLEVVDNGRGPSTPNPAGHGLVGMRDRVTLYNGTVAAGPAPGGGFRVLAELPLEDGG